MCIYSILTNYKSPNFHKPLEKSWREMKLQSRKIQRQNADWSNLPDELLELIVNFLKYNGTDYARFRAVCRKWCNSSPPLSNFLNLDFPREITTSSGRSIHLISYVVCILYPLTQKHYNRNPKHCILSLEEFHKLRMCHPLTDDLIGVNKSPKSINSLDFGYRILDFGVKLRFAGSANDVFCCEGHLVPTMYRWKDNPAKAKSILLKNEGIVVVLLLRLKGVLGTFRVNENLKFNDYSSSSSVFDDIVDFKGGVCAITPSGDAWLLKDLEREGSPFTQPLNKSSLKLEFTRERIMRKRLAVYDGELYMIVRVPCKFVIFKLNEELQEWERLYSLGDKILFVTYDKCIFVETCYLPGCKGNCILFPKNCFPSFGRGREWLEDDALFQGTTKPFEIGVFNMGDDSYRLISSYPELSKLFWPPPSWLWLDSCSSKRGFSEEDENTASCGHIGSESSSVNQIITNFLQHRKNEQCAENPSSSLGQKHTTVEEAQCENNDNSDPALNSLHEISGSLSTKKNYQRADVSLDLVQHMPSLKQVGVDSLPLIRSSSKIALGSASRKKFQGICVSSEWLPVLQKVWDKHGNVIERHVVHSDGLLTWALESLAKMVIILQENTGYSLNNSQAEYLNSTLADLHMMHFRLDWIVPFIERALAIHKSKCQKIVLMELETRKSKLLAELHELEEQMVEQEKLVAESLVDFAPSVLEKGLAEGLC